MKRISFLITFFVVITSFSQAKISHSKFDLLLQKMVNNQGMVNYFRLKTNQHLLNEYLEILQKNPPKTDWEENEKLAYWINAYNAFTLKLIITHYPVKSIKDIGSTIKIPFVNSPWDIKFIKIGDKTYNLNNIEHGIIRKSFDEPRIHFALVCAASSCPKLSNRAYLPKMLNKQLENAAKDFINDHSKNELTSTNEVKLSKLFSWYKGDFTKKTDLISYINHYANKKIKPNAKIRFKSYSWKLNEQISD